MFYGFSSSLLCGFRPPYIIFSIYIYYELYISYSIFLSGSFDARSSPTHQRFLPWRILAFPAVLTAKMRFSTMGKCWGKPTNEENPPMRFLHVGKSGFMLFEPPHFPGNRQLDITKEQHGLESCFGHTERDASWGCTRFAPLPWNGQCFRFP